MNSTEFVVVVQAIYNKLHAAIDLISHRKHFSSNEREIINIGKQRLTVND